MAARRARKQRIFVDFTVENHGSIFLLRPNTAAGRVWIEEHIPADASFMGDAVAVEHRYIADIVAGILADGYGVN